MSDNVFLMENQLPFVVYSAVLGLIGGIFFDILAVKNIFFSKNRIISALDDFILTVVLFLILFFFALEYNHGKIRWYNLFIFFCGIFLYRKTAGKFLRPIIQKMFELALVLIKRACMLILYPANRLLGAVGFMYKKLLPLYVRASCEHKYNKEKKKFTRLAAVGFNILEKG